MVRPDQDAWGDGGIAIYRDGQLWAETNISAAQLADVLPAGSQAAVIASDIPAAQFAAVAEKFGLVLTEQTYDSGWLGRLGEFPDQLADVLPYDPERED